VSAPPLLFLFSSNIRPLYEQDILDVLAAPAGGLYQFRYERRWVDPTAREHWLSLPEGTPVLVHFSLQQRARYHEAVFFPIRRGTVKRVFAEGETLFVEFLLGDLVGLHEPAKREGDRADFAAETRSYANYLAEQGVPRPYEFSAGLGPDILSDSVAPLDLASDQVTLFERITKYLQPTDSFRDARFFRFLRLGPRGEDADVEPEVASHRPGEIVRA
jgi:hypothetical protein